MVKMRSTGLLSALLLLSSTEAKLSCLGWSLLNPFLGSFCVMSPGTWDAAGNAVDSTAKKAVNGTIFETVEQVVSDTINEFTNGVSDALDFVVEHSPLNVAWQFYQDRDNTTQAVANLKSSLGEDVSASFGFTKETVNQAVQTKNLVSLFDFQSIATCLVLGASKQRFPPRKTPGQGSGHTSNTRPGNSSIGSSSTGSSLTSRDAHKLTTNDAVRVGTDCFNDKFKQIAGPAVFNITDPNEKVGATLSDIAMLFVPFEELGAGTKAGKGAYYLALAGEEDGTKLLKYVGEETTAGYFASREESLAVRQQMRDKKWVKANCGTCPLPGVGLRRRDVRRLQRRGSALSACCKVPTSAEQSTHPYWSDEEENFDLLGDPPSDSESEFGDAVSELPEYFDPYNWGRYISEAELSPAPDFHTWALEESGIAGGLRNDIYDLNSAIVEGPQDSQVLSIDDALAKFRKGLSAERGDPLHDALAPNVHIGDKEYGGEEWYRQILTTGAKWMKSTDPQVKDLQVFSQKMMDHVKDIMGKAKPHLTPEELADFQYEIEYHYTPPIEEAKLGVDPRGPHQDRTTASLIAADRPGLVVSTGAEKGTDQGFARSPNKPGTLHFLRGLAWDFSENKEAVGVVGGTTHTVFGDVIAKEGRLSMIVNVFKEAELNKLSGKGVNRFVASPD